ncbi:MAG: flagellar biosynthesis protein [Rhodobacter sp.]|nr:flagellar biosynthesis protein [Rhodobacter sp.]
MPLQLEDFDAGTAEPLHVAGQPAMSAITEADRMAAYEKGYQAGWDDAARAEAEDQTRIGTDFARNLQELSFTFHEARAHVIQAMQPLLTQMTGTLLPALVSETLAETVWQELEPLVEECADAPIDLMVAPESRAALEARVPDTAMATLRITEEPSLAPGQVYLRMGRTERKIDLTGAQDRMIQAIDALYAQNERTLKYG